MNLRKPFFRLRRRFALWCRYQTWRKKRLSYINENLELRSVIRAMGVRAEAVEELLRDKQEKVMRLQAAITHFNAAHHPGVRTRQYDLRPERQAHARGLQSACDAQRALIADQRQEIRGYIEQDVIAGKKWRDKFEAAAVEVRLLRKTGLSSGCSCPIGVCLGAGKSTALGGACWVQWAEGFVLKRRGELIIDELRTQASHPARVAAAQRQRALAGTPDADP
jgi:hypothetical protein